MVLAPPEPRSGAEAPGTGKQARNGPAIVGDRYRIEPGSPLIGLDTPSAKAYEVEDLRDSARKLFALICTPGLPPRANAMAILRGSSAEGLLPLVEWSAVHWPPLKRHCMAVVYERPLGGKFAESFTSIDAKMSERNGNVALTPAIGDLELACLGETLAPHGCKAEHYLSESYDTGHVLGISDLTAPGVAPS